MKYAGIDIGGTKCAVVLGNEKGDILNKVKFDTTTFPETFHQIIAETESMGKFDAIGISCGGPLDSEKGVIIAPPNLPDWNNVEIVKILNEKFKVPVFLKNDADACALAEWNFGAGRGTKNMIFLTFGTGMGAGLILNGQLYSGTCDCAGEIGHIRMTQTGPVGYGKEGSFEGFCSGGGISRLAVMMAKRRRQMPKCIADMGGYEAVTTKKLAEAAFAGDRFAKQVFDKSGEMLGRGLSLVIDIINPERVVIGGVFMRSGELLIPAMQKAIDREALSDSAHVCEIVAAKLSENVGDIAALAIAEGAIV